MTTIKDIARRAGVSITSVSYALNGTGTISELTRQRVLEAAEALNYHPNAFARNLKKPKTRTIGVFIYRFGGSFYEDILDGIHETVFRAEYELIVCPESRTVRKILTYRQVDGAIIFDTRIGSDILIRLASERFPIVVMDRNLKGEYLLPMLIDNEKGVREGFKHLYEQGARRMYYVAGAQDSLDNTERREAFLSEAQKHDLEVRCFHGNFTEQSGYFVAQQIIAARELPDAVFCANDQMAIGFMKAMKEYKVKVPEDVAVIGFDDIQIAQYLRPSLTTIGASRMEWGSSAATQLIDFLENEKPFSPFRIPTRLIVRESSLLHRKTT